MAMYRSNLSPKQKETIATLKTVTDGGGKKKRRRGH